jgi:hypothetical protein
VGYDLFYSLADGYLKTCMDEWPQLPQAKKCFREYEAFIEFAYSGSGGTHLPEEVKAELDAYRKRLKP